MPAPGFACVVGAVCAELDALPDAAGVAEVPALAGGLLVPQAASAAASAKAAMRVIKGWKFMEFSSLASGSWTGRV
jgi:hypothetical protein